MQVDRVALVPQGVTLTEVKFYTYLTPLSVATVKIKWAVVVAQLVQRSLPTPVVRSLNPVMVKTLYYLYTASCIEKTKIATYIA